jgi:hypothetical protein
VGGGAGIVVGGGAVVVVVGGTVVVVVGAAVVLEVLAAAAADVVARLAEPGFEPPAPPQAARPRMSPSATTATAAAFPRRTFEIVISASRLVEPRTLGRERGSDSFEAHAESLRSGNWRPIGGVHSKALRTLQNKPWMYAHVSTGALDQPSVKGLHGTPAGPGGGGIISTGDAREAPPRNCVCPSRSATEDPDRDVGAVESRAPVEEHVWEP